MWRVLDPCAALCLFFVHSRIPWPHCTLQCCLPRQRYDGGCLPSLVPAVRPSFPARPIRVSTSTVSSSVTRQGHPVVAPRADPCGTATPPPHEDRRPLLVRCLAAVALPLPLAPALHTVVRSRCATRTLRLPFLAATLLALAGRLKAVGARGFLKERWWMLQAELGTTSCYTFFVLYVLTLVHSTRPRGPAVNLLATTTSLLVVHWGWRGCDTMSDVPISASRLACLVCGCVLHTRSGVRTHMLRRHNRLAPPAAAAGEGPGVNGVDAPDAAAVSHRAALAEPSNSGAVAGDASWADAAAPDAAAGANGAAHPADLGGPAGQGVAANDLDPLREQPPRHLSADARVHAAIDAEMQGYYGVAPMQSADANPHAHKRRRSGASGGAEAEERNYATIATEVRALYESRNDWPKSVPLLTLRKQWQASQFDSFRLRAVERFALESCGGSGLTLDDQTRLYNLLDIWDGTQPGMPVDDGHGHKLRHSFPTCNAFKTAIKDDIDSAVVDAGWRKVVLLEDGMELVAYFRSALDVVLRMLHAAEDIQLWSGGDRPAPPTDARESPMDGDAFRKNEQIVVNKHGHDCFVIGLHVFSDASHVSWSGGKLVPMAACPSSFLPCVVVHPNSRLFHVLTHPLRTICVLASFLIAHKLYPLRIRVVNIVTQKEEWITVAYIPMVRKQKESAADERGRARRSSVLQRVLYLVFRSSIRTSHDGVDFEFKGRKLKAFPRILLYLCDYPEEKAVLGLKSGETNFPCSNCTATKGALGDVQSLSSLERDAVTVLQDQLEASRLLVQNRLTARRNYLEKLHSVHSVAPALAGMAGLSSEPFLMYQVIGFDSLHVRYAVRCHLPRTAVVRVLCVCLARGSVH